VAVLPVDEPRLGPAVAEVPPARRITFGPRLLSPTVGVDEVVAGPAGVHFQLHLAGLTSRSGVSVALPLVGAHNAIDAACAAACARALDIGEGAILDGLATVRPAKHRLQLITAGDRYLLDDCYNASPLSTRAALEAMLTIALPGRRKVAVLGDMLELGPDGARLHAEVGAFAAERVDELIAFGPQARQIAAAAVARLGADHVLHTEDPTDAAERVLEVTGPGDLILIKASRGMRLERVIDALNERLGAG
jgi:UDP-N-acetylmuramoyl-tripeptide--D-alanyl-D-alanine ligase